MKVTGGDYVLLPIGTRTSLCRVTSVGDGEHKKYKATQEGKDGVVFDFSTRDIIANFGSNPKVGTYLGTFVEPLREVMAVEGYGEVRIYRECDENWKKGLKKQLLEFYSRRKKKAIPSIPVELEIRTPRGKYAGLYKFRPKAETDILVAMPADDLSSMDYILAHEWAHGLWGRCMSQKMQMAWIKLYHDAITLSKIKKDTLDVLLRDIQENGDLGSFYKESDEETQKQLRCIFRHMKQVHNMDKRHFQMAIVLQEDVSEWWPERLELGEKQVMLSDYATKSPEELFAEAHAYWFVGKQIPRKPQELLTKCLTNMKR
jgi:hypothetical protein